ncbi:MAG: hypothetical protein H0V23_05490 [Nocardioidaceae bacterium]|nr:hypothetical protein [Nocardioidaceae bacterium]
MAASAQGKWADVLTHAERSLSYTDALGLASESTRWVWSIAADAALALGDYAEVERLLGWLDEYPIGHIPPVLRAERFRIRARLLAAQADPEAGAAFDAATKAFRELGSPYHLAVGLLDHAEHLAATGNTGTAQQFAAEADAIAQRLGAKPLTARALALLPGGARSLTPSTGGDDFAPVGAG